MAIRGTINELYDLSSLEGQQKAVLDFIKQYVDSVKAANAIQITLGSAKGAKETAAAIKQLNLEQQKLADLQLKIAKAETEYAKARVQSNKADGEAIKNKKQQIDLEAKQAKEKDKIVTAAEKEMKTIEKLNNEYVQLNNRYKEASAASLKRGAELLKESNGNDALFRSLLKTDQSYLQTTKDAKKYSDQLLSLEQSVGRSQRNVGNYASAYNGLGTSFARIAQEMPSLTISFQQFALAISNNLPIAAEQIQLAKEKIAALKAEGQAAPSLFSQITKSIFSFQVGLSIGITLFVAFSKQIGEFISGLFNSKSALDGAGMAAKEYAENIERATEALSEFNDEVSQEEKLNKIRNQLRKGNESEILDFELKALAVKEDRIKADKIQAEQELKNIQEINNAKLGTTNIFGSTTELSKEDIEVQNNAFKLVQDLEKKRIEIINQRQIKELEIRLQRKKEAEEEADKLKKESEKRRDIIKKNLEDEAKARREAILAMLEEEAAFQKEIADDENKSFETRIQAAENFYQIQETIANENKDFELAALKAKQKELKLTDDQVIEQRLQIEAKYQAQTLKNIRVNQEQIKKITLDNLKQIDKERADLFKQQLDRLDAEGELRKANLNRQRDEELTSLAKEARAKEEALLAEGAGLEKINASREAYKRKELEINTRYNKLVLQSELDKVKGMAEFEPDPLKKAKLLEQAANIELQLNKLVTDEEIKNIDRRIKKEQELADLQKRLQEEVFNLAKSFVLGRFDAAKNAIQDEIDLLEEKKNKEIEAINATSLNAVEKQARISNAEKKAQVERDRLEVKRRQVDIQRAKFEKAFQIAQIIGNTADAITKSLALYPLPAGAGFVALNAAIGAVQVATVLAQPIPKFKTGKGQYDQYEGPAWVGDGGKSEMIIRKDGTAEFTPNTPTLTYIGKDDIIHPDANALMNHTLRKQGETYSYGYGEGYAFDVMTNTLSKKLDNVAKVIENKREYMFSIKNGETNVVTRDGTRTKEYLNKNLQFGK